MTARRKVGSIRTLSPGVHRVEVSVGHDPITGKRRRFDRTIRGTRHDAETVLARLLLQAGSAPSSSMTLKTYLEDMWLPSVEGKVRTRTRIEYEKKLRLYVTPHLGHMRLTVLEPYQLDRWCRALAETGISKRTQLHAYRVLHTALHQAVRWRLLPNNMLDSVDPPSPKREDPAVLTADQANAYLDAFTGHVLEPIVTIALAAGLRRSELAALTWRDLDLDAATVTVWRGMHEDAGVVHYEDPKTERSRRVVSLPAWAVSGLRPLRGVGPIVSQDGAAMKPDRITYLYGKHVRTAGLVPAIPLKNLRHTHATLALAAGADVVSVSRRLGHSTVNTTDAFYLHPGRSADIIVAEKIGTLRQAR